MKIKYIGHSYHQKTKSSSFFLDLLSGMGEVSVVWDDSWQTGRSIDHRASVSGYDLVVVFQLPDVIRTLAKAGCDNLVFVPMYDAAFNLGAKFWKALWNVKVVCFSAAMYEICCRNRVHCHYIRYFPEPMQVSVQQGAEHSIFVWQRRSYPSWETVAQHIPYTHFDRLHLHVALDFPGEVVTCPTPEESRSVRLTQSRWFDEKGELEAVMQSCAYFLAPRDREGIGLSFLDAMRIGLLVIGLDHSTLNEYVVHGVNGFLISEGGTRRFDLPEDVQVMREMSRHYLEKGRKAYLRHLPDLIDFVRKPWRGSRIRIHSKLAFDWRMRTVKHPEVKRARLSEGVEPLLSVVTVVRNDLPGMARTLSSVFCQSFRQFEYIVVDGASTDKTVNFIKANADGIDVMLSEPDQGPYDAMQKGLSLARGKYVLFLNAGDELCNARTLEDVFCSLPGDPDVIYGHHFYIDDRGRPAVRLARALGHAFSELREGLLSRAWLFGIPCHQATIIKRSLVQALKFDPSFRIAADQHLLFRALAAGVSSYHANMFIANYYQGGVSSHSVMQCVAEWQRIGLAMSEHDARIQRFYADLR